MASLCGHLLRLLAALRVARGLRGVAGVGRSAQASSPTIAGLLCTPLLRRPAAVLWNANPLLPQQWAAVGLVFSGLLVSSWTKSRRGHHHAKLALAPEKAH